VKTQVSFHSNLWAKCPNGIKLFIHEEQKYKEIYVGGDVGGQTWHGNCKYLWCWTIINIQYLKKKFFFQGNCEGIKKSKAKLKEIIKLGLCITIGSFLFLLELLISIHSHSMSRPTIDLSSLLYVCLDDIAKYEIFFIIDFGYYYY